LPRLGNGNDADVPTFPESRSNVAPADSAPAPANGLAAWTVTATGGHMRLVEATPPSTTALISYRHFWLPPVMQDSTKPAFHFHPGTELVTILCGTVVYGEASHVDYSKAHDYGPGSFLENPAGNPHFEWFRGPLEIEMEYIGAPGATQLDPQTGQVK
jgi:hypothetical protein